VTDFSIEPADLAPALDIVFSQLDRERFVDALWARRADIWSSDYAIKTAIFDRLGWLEAVEFATRELSHVETFVQRVRSAAFTDVVLFGMGGSSLAPEVFHRLFGRDDDHPRFRTLDSTDPATRFTLVAEAAGRVLALATYVRRRFAHHSAELGFLVADDLRGRGMGTRLLELLADVARADGITEFAAETLRTNTRMLDVFREVGFPMTERADEDICHVTMSIAATNDYLDRTFDRTRAAAATSMRALFEPFVVAVVGASRTRGRIGSEIFHNLLDSGFVGAAIPVNTTADTIEGIKAYPSISSIPGQVDVAVIAVPCEQVLAVADECIAKNVKGLVVISAGFGEASAEGQRLQAQLLERVRDAGIRMIGPNCMGLLNTNPAVRLNATFAPTRPPVGNVAMSTQSGALGLAILDYAKELNIGISSFVSVGNKADVSGRMTKALGDGPWRLVTAVMVAMAVVVEPSDML